MTASGCVFCDIAAGAAEASVVHAGDSAVVFLDIKHVTPGHMLVIPRRHASSLEELSPGDGAEMFRAGLLATSTLRSSALRCDGVNLFLADGVAAGQEVFHVHLHVFPRFEHDGFGLRFGPDNRKRPGRAELERIAARLRDSITK